MTPARIMIVEDERITAEHLREVLTELGYTVTGAVASAADAIRHAETSRPDLVLMDIHIEGEMDGVEAAYILRERYQIPAIYLTAHADTGTLERARQAQPLGYIVKPFQESELEASIEMALYKNRMDREAHARERRLGNTLSAVAEAVIAVDREGAVTFLSPTAAEWTEWPPESSVGMAGEEVLRLIDGKSRCAAEHILRQVLRTGSPVDLAPGIHLLSRHGTERPIAGSAVPITGIDGELAGAVFVFGAPPNFSDPLSPAAATQNVSQFGGFSLIHESSMMRRIVAFAIRVAASEVSTILLEGESGTGKDVLAKFIHYNSPRAEGPFVAINCAAIPETLLESELFGYEKGAFTDARSQKRGTLELANSGTVFLDEIGEMPLSLQAKLLRVLEEQTFRRLGGVKDLQLDLRVIAATNRPLADAVRAGIFRTDLYYRLNVIQIQVPPLRQRRDDILPLARHFISMYSHRFHRPIRGLAPEASRALVEHHWPGNVRELRNTIERAMVLEESDWLRPSGLELGGPQLLAEPVPSKPSPDGLEGLSLEDAERLLLARALERSGGNQTRAARLLNVSRDTLRYKMKKFNIGTEF